MNKIKEELTKLLPKNSFIRSVSVLMVGGTATAQVISILASPILIVRLYSTEDFGLLPDYRKK